MKRRTRRRGPPPARPRRPTAAPGRLAATVLAEPADASHGRTPACRPLDSADGRTDTQTGAPRSTRHGDADARRAQAAPGPLPTPFVATDGHATDAATTAAARDPTVHAWGRVRARFGDRIEWFPMAPPTTGPAHAGSTPADRDPTAAAPLASAGAPRSKAPGTIDTSDPCRAPPTPASVVPVARLRRARDPIATGDLIELARQSHDWVVERRLPRRNAVRRIDGFGRVKTIAANVDRIWLAVTHSPPPAELMLERMLAAVYALDAEPVLLWTKVDLVDAASKVCVHVPAPTPDRRPDDAESRDRPDPFELDRDALIAHMPEPLGRCVRLATLGLDVTILPVSTRSGLGLDAVRAHARGATNLLLGTSGVGKTSLLRALLGNTMIDADDDPALRVSALGRGGEGQHTTTTARLHVVVDPQAAAPSDETSAELQPLAGPVSPSPPSAALWIDAPGVRDFTPVIDDERMLARGFPEITLAAEHCRFRDCRHAAEPGCAVRSALGHSVSPTRFAVWQQIANALRHSPP